MPPRSQNTRCRSLRLWQADHASHAAREAPPQQAGVFDLPQTPPPPVQTAPQRPETVGRPPIGDPTEIPWFRGQVRNILKNGPVFGARKDEFLPFLFIRAKAGDRGGRKINGEFWESPDIYVAPNLV